MAETTSYRPDIIDAGDAVAGDGFYRRMHDKYLNGVEVPPCPDMRCSVAISARRMHEKFGPNGTGSGAVWEDE
jgi:hypothetical protein